VERRRDTAGARAISQMRRTKGLRLDAYLLLGRLPSAERPSQTDSERERERGGGRETAMMHNEIL